MIRNFAPLVILFATTVTAGGHDIWGLSNPVVNDPELQVSEEFAVAASRQPNSSRERYVLERALLWSPGAQLRACFLNGDSQDQSRVTEAVNNLRLSKNGVNIQINFTGDCQPNTPEEIRISFNHGCCSAYVGRTALHPKLRGGPTVFLQSGVPTYIVQHEILHTLAVHHEHQNPDGVNCYEQLVDVEAYARSNGWDTSTVKDNLAAFGRNQKKFIWSQGRDEQSITHYHVPPSYLKGGRSNPCFVNVNSQLSVKDYEGLRVAYPAGADGVASRRNGIEALKTVALPEKLTAFLRSVPLD